MSKMYAGICKSCGQKYRGRGKVYCSWMCRYGKEPPRYWLGKKLSPITINKIKLARAIQKPYWTGLSRDLSTKKKISQKVKYLWSRSEYAKHMSDAHKGQRNSIKTEFKKGSKPTNGFPKGVKLFLGKHHSEETKRKMSNAKRGVKNPSNTGDKNWNWKGGISKLNRSKRQLVMLSCEYKNWRHNIMERDDYTCQICKKRGGLLHVDHIKPWSLYPELIMDDSNARVLCAVCHRKTETYGNKIYFQYKNSSIMKTETG